jgi:hypothetical protein
VLHLHADLSEMDRRLISERSALAARKAQGKKLRNRGGHPRADRLRGRLSVAIMIAREEPGWMARPTSDRDVGGNESTQPVRPIKARPGCGPGVATAIAETNRSGLSFKRPETARR